MKRTTHSTTFKVALTLVFAISALGTVSATPKLDGVSFDPAFISAGDRVNISANLWATDYPEKTWDKDKTLKVILKPGNRLTRKYVTIEENRDESIGFLYPQGVWNQRYQVKIDSNAPTGMYDFELHIQYLENGNPVSITTAEGESNITVIKEFSMPVDNEGVDLTADVVKTQPSVPRPGDDYVQMSLSFTNTGNKPIEEVELRPETPENIESSHSKDEKFFIGRINPGETYSQTYSVNLNEQLEPGTHRIKLKATYEDADGNPYSETLKVPLRVEGRPDLEVVGGQKVMKAGATKALRVSVRNTGEQDAESVTARVIAERTQPFALEDRSSYIGEIQPGETAEAVLKVSADRSAALKTHQLKIQLRSTGDSEEGDNSVYTFTEEVDVKLSGRTRSPLVFGGIAAAFLVLGASIYRYRDRFRGGESEE
ncbi:MAG: COG1361 S-layer family protein [Candidatus Nanohaloarchaea archaeon]